MCVCVFFFFLKKKKDCNELFKYNIYTHTQKNNEEQNCEVSKVYVHHHIPYKCLWSVEIKRVRVQVSRREIHTHIYLH